MSLWRRDKWFWTDFSVNGVRYRVPLKDTKCRRTWYPPYLEPAVVRGAQQVHPDLIRKANASRLLDRHRCNTSQLGRFS
jgi:hypothetical protein